MPKKVKKIIREMMEYTDSTSDDYAASHGQEVAAKLRGFKRRLEETGEKGEVVEMAVQAIDMISAILGDCGYLIDTITELKNREV